MIAADNAQHAATIHLAASMNGATGSEDKENCPAEGSEREVTAQQVAVRVANALSKIEDTGFSGDKEFVEEIFSSQQRCTPAPVTFTAETFRKLQSDNDKLSDELRDTHALLEQESVAKAAALQEKLHLSQQLQQATQSAVQKELHAAAAQQAQQKAHSAEMASRYESSTRALAAAEQESAAALTEAEARHASALSTLHEDAARTKERLQLAAAQREALATELDELKLTFQKFKASAKQLVDTAEIDYACQTRELEVTIDMLQNVRATNECSRGALQQQDMAVATLRQQLSQTQQSKHVQFIRRWRNSTKGKILHTTPC